MIEKTIVKNLVFYWQKVVLSSVLISFLVFIAVASLFFSSRIKKIADKPLHSLQTEIILQKDRADKDASKIKTNGIIEPFNLKSFPKKKIEEALAKVPEIKNYSSAFVLWQFDIKNNKTIVGLDKDDPLVGLRKIEQWLTPKSKFFSGNNVNEVILERHFAKLFGYKLNGVYDMGDRHYKIVGIVDFKEESNLSNAQVFIPYQTALDLVDAKQPLVNQVYISLSHASLLVKTKKEIEKILPDFSIITKDRLLKNLSSFNRMIYQFGNYFVLGIGCVALLLIAWILKISHLEFEEQTQILKTIGWPSHKIRRWTFFESGVILLFSLLISSFFLMIFYLLLLPNIHLGVSINQNFKL